MHRRPGYFCIMWPIKACGFSCVYSVTQMMHQDDLASQNKPGHSNRHDTVMSRTENNTFFQHLYIFPRKIKSPELKNLQ